MRLLVRLLLQVTAVMVLAVGCSGSGSSSVSEMTAEVGASRVRTSEAEAGTSTVTTSEAEPETDVMLLPPLMGPSALQLAAGAWATWDAPPVGLGALAAVEAAAVWVLVYGADPTARQPVGGSVAAAARFDVATGVWVVLARPSGPVREGAVSVWFDGTWFLLGGHSIDGDAFDDGIAWDAATDSWGPVSAAPFTAWDAAADPSGVYVTDHTGTAVAVLDPVALTWEVLPPPPSGSPGWAAGIVVHDGELHLFRTFEPDDITRGPVTEGFRFTDTGWVSLGPADSPTATDLVSTSRGIIGSEGSYCRAAWGCPLRGTAVAVTLDDDGGWQPRTDELFGDGRAIWTGRLLVFSAGGSFDSHGVVGSPTWDPATETWTTLPRPPDQYTELVAVGDRVVALGAATYVLSPPLVANVTNDGTTITVELSHIGPLAETRGVCWVLERWDPARGWVEAAHVVEDEVSTGLPVEPYPVDVDPRHECPDIGLTGPGPDTVRVPVDAVPADLHRLCHGSRPGSGQCVNIEIPEPT